MVQLGFYLLSLASLLMLWTIFRHAEQSKRFAKWYFVFCLGWLIYLVIIQKLGLLENFDLPPRMPLLIVIPIVLFIVWVTSNRSFRTLLSQTPLHLPIFLQSFRIAVELLIYGAYLKGVFPKTATFEGINYDILVGISAPIVGVLVLLGKIDKKAVLIWNIAALLILSLTVYSFISTYYFTDYLVTTGTKEFAKFPYLLLASVLLPTAIFLHVLSLRQVLQKRVTS